ncbi:actin, putative [Entamoeba invadens IP1]|uniref:Actin, putative n=1 Tax=Entamoeba invadens IP1 TaxID=370355 RepID=A0A0A1TVA6_ENTIV|nr:actin, putative [Entamoeba invadens IP1]ELP84282.1 actin, putative [Entamoeba invadens IP1]|eukprot:XP_004183628.1 actin, putative [Entamoeba invadens IP1]
MEESIKTVIIDNGCSMTKAGFGGDDAPISVFQTIVGNPKSKVKVPSLYSPPSYVGEYIIKCSEFLNLKCPLERGLIKDFDCMKQLWDHTFCYELRTNPSEGNVLLTEVANNTAQNREKTTQIMFEEFEVKGLYIGLQPLLTLYNAGRTTGTVLEMGDSVTQCISVNKGNVSKESFVVNNFGGDEVSTFIQKTLKDRSSVFELQSAGKHIARDIKEKICYVASNFVEAIQRSQNEVETEYKLPDGESILVGKERFLACEAYFQPSLLNLECLGIHQMICNSIRKYNKDVTKVLYENIVVGGGPSLTQGLFERIYKEISNFSPQNIKIKTIKNQDRKYSAFLGASILASLDSFMPSFITKKVYEENGASFINSHLF